MNIETNAKIKGLQTRIAKARAEEVTARNIAKETRIEHETKKKHSQRLLKELKELEDSLKKGEQGIQVTEHALLRYAERIMGFNKEEVIAELLPPATVKTLNELGGTATIKRNGNEIVVKDYKVITIK